MIVRNTSDVLKMYNEFRQIDYAFEIIDKFANGLSVSDKDVVYATCQIKEDSPNDPIIKYLKASGYAVEFKQKANEILEAEEKMKIHSEMYKMRIQLLNGVFHMYRELPISDEWIQANRKTNSRFEERILKNL